jgi:putative ABC transport system permease protein
LHVRIDMKIPLFYNVRNLRTRIGATLLTTAGIAITVSVVVLLSGLLAGLRHAFVASGDPLNLLLLRKGLNTEYASSVTTQQFQAMKSLPGITQTADQQPMASIEAVMGVVLPRRHGAGDANITLRGVSAAGIALRPKIRIVEGRWFNAGQREVVAGKSARRRFDVSVGTRIVIGRGEWTVVGIFDNGDTAQESELWADVNQVTADSPRPHFSSMLVKAQDEQALKQLMQRIENDPRLGLAVYREQVYYAQQTATASSLKFVGLFMAIIMGIGSCFAAANTMFASVAYRGPEIAILRILGFSRSQILGSFVTESILIALAGGVLGVAAVLPLNGFTTGTLNSFTFSEMIFKMQITPAVILTAFATAVMMGILGGLLPALQASRQNIAVAMRH